MKGQLIYSWLSIYLSSNHSISYHILILLSLLLLLFLFLLLLLISTVSFKDCLEPQYMLSRPTGLLTVLIEILNS